MKPFFDIQAQYQAHKQEINQVIQNVLDSGQFIMGPQVKALEQQLEAYTGAKHCITCANGTDALQIAMMAIGIKPGDEVITTPFTFIATAETIALLGAKPVFVDIEEDSYLINAELIEQKITAKTKAIIPVSLYGQIPDMDRINEIAEKYSQKLGHKIYVIEDAAQSFGAEYKNKKSCNVSEIATTSFFPTKPLGCYGDGGAIFTSADKIAEIVKQIRVHGQEKRYHHVRVGVNSRLDTIQAAILQVKLKYLDQEIETRRKIAQQYNEEYKATDIITPIIKKNRTHVYGQYTVRTKYRDQFIADLKKQGIPTTIHYPIPLNQQPAFKDTNANCPVSDKLSDQVVSLPMCLYDEAVKNANHI
jgi:UDP-2-acetamido-2-deoxy-ribo-hexuluronate aminotransferase